MEKQRVIVEARFYEIGKLYNALYDDTIFIYEIKNKKDIEVLKKRIGNLYKYDFKLGRKYIIIYNDTPCSGYYNIIEVTDEWINALTSLINIDINQKKVFKTAETGVKK